MVPADQIAVYNVGPQPLETGGIQTYPYPEKTSPRARNGQSITAIRSRMRARERTIVPTRGRETQDTGTGRKRSSGSI